MRYLIYNLTLRWFEAESKHSLLCILFKNYFIDNLRKANGTVLLLLLPYISFSSIIGSLEKLFPNICIYHKQKVITSDN